MNNNAVEFTRRLVFKKHKYTSSRLFLIHKSTIRFLLIICPRLDSFSYQTLSRMSTGLYESQSTVRVNCFYFALTMYSSSFLQAISIYVAFVSGYLSPSWEGIPDVPKSHYKWLLVESWYHQGRFVQYDTFYCRMHREAWSTQYQVLAYCTQPSLFFRGKLPGTGTIICHVAGPSRTTCDRRQHRSLILDFVRAFSIMFSEF